MVFNSSVVCCLWLGCAVWSKLVLWSLMGGTVGTRLSMSSSAAVVVASVTTVVAASAAWTLPTTAHVVGNRISIVFFHFRCYSTHSGRGLFLLSVGGTRTLSSLFRQANRMYYSLKKQMQISIRDASREGIVSRCQGYRELKRKSGLRMEQLCSWTGSLRGSLVVSFRFSNTLLSTWS